MLCCSSWVVCETTTGIPESFEVEEEEFFSTTVLPQVPDDTKEVLEGKKSAVGSKLGSNSTEHQNSILSLHDRVYLYLKEVRTNEFSVTFTSLLWLSKGFYLLIISTIS